MREPSARTVKPSSNTTPLILDVDDFKVFFGILMLCVIDVIDDILSVVLGVGRFLVRCFVWESGGRASSLFPRGGC